MLKNATKYISLFSFVFVALDSIDCGSKLGSIGEIKITNCDQKPSYKKHSKVPTNCKAALSENSNNLCSDSYSITEPTTNTTHYWKGKLDTSFQLTAIKMWNANHDNKLNNIQKNVTAKSNGEQSNSLSNNTDGGNTTMISNTTTLLIDEDNATNVVKDKDKFVQMNFTYLLYNDKDKLISNVSLSNDFYTHTFILHNIDFKSFKIMKIVPLIAVNDSGANYSSSLAFCKIKVYGYQENKVYKHLRTTGYLYVIIVLLLVGIPTMYLLYRRHSQKMQRYKEAAETMERNAEESSYKFGSLKESKTENKLDNNVQIQDQQTPGDSSESDPESDDNSDS